MKIVDDLPTSNTGRRPGQYAEMFLEALAAAKKYPGRHVQIDGVHEHKVYGAGRAYAKRAPYKTPEGQANIRFRNTYINPKTGKREGNILLTWEPAETSK